MSLIDFEQGQCKRTSARLEEYVNGQLRAETVEALERHLNACPRCRQAAADRSRVKSLLQQAVMRDVAPLDLRYRIKRDIRKNAAPFRWTTWALAAAAAVVLLAGAFGVVRILDSSRAAPEQAVSAQNTRLLNIGLGDHVRCAIDHGMASRSFTRQEMYRQLGPDYAEVVDLAKDKVPGEYEVIVGHRCHVDGREFIHLILRNQTETFSLIMTQKNQESFAADGLAATLNESGIPVYQRELRKFQVAGFETRDHLVFVVSTLGDRENLQLASGLAPAVRDFLAKRES